MDSRLIAVIDRLSEDLGNLEKALAHTQELLKELAKEARKNGKISKKELATVRATERFLAGQQRQRDGTFPQRRWMENDDSD